MKPYLITLATITALVSACTPVERHSTGDTLKGPPNWKPESVHITCPSGDCPQGVGLFMLVKREQDQSTSITRCTASLIESDVIMTNDHCSMEGTQEAYFFLAGPDGVVLRRNVTTQIYKISLQREMVDRDLALWRLSEPVVGLTPLRVSREIPPDMSKLVSFVIDEGREATRTWQSSFNVTRRECTTKPNVPYFQMGVDDQRAGLALFDCAIQHGNSGSPVFTPQDLTQVQAVINSIVNDDNQTKPIGAEHHSQFVASEPAYLNKFFAVAERVQCLPIPGLAAPAVPCALTNSFRDIVKPVVSDVLDQFYAGPITSDGIRWGARALSARARGNPKQGVILIPVPLCFEHLPREVGLKTRALKFVPIGIAADGRPHSIEAGDTHFNYRLNQDSLYEITVESSMSYQNEYVIYDKTADILNPPPRTIHMCIDNEAINDRESASRDFDKTNFPY